MKVGAVLFVVFAFVRDCRQNLLWCHWNSGRGWGEGGGLTEFFMFWTNHRL